MSTPFFENPILNSPDDLPQRHRELDSDGQPTHRNIETRIWAEFISPMPKQKKRKGLTEQQIVFDEGNGLSTEAEQYEQTSLINAVCQEVGKWRSLPTEYLAGDAGNGTAASALEASPIQPYPPLLVPD